MRFVYVTGRYHRFVINLDHVVNMVPTEHPIEGGKVIRTIVAFSNPNEEGWCIETIDEIMRAVQSQDAHQSGCDVIDVAQWSKYHSKGQS